MCVCVCVCVRARVRACVRACEFIVFSRVPVTLWTLIDESSMRMQFYSSLEMFASLSWRGEHLRYTISHFMKYS